MIERPETPEEMRELFVACADVVRRYGKQGIPTTSLALAFGLVWSHMNDDEAAAFFDLLATDRDEVSARGAMMPRRPANHRGDRPGRFRAWFS